MDPLIIGFIVFALILAGAFAGWAIRQCLPAHHLSDETKSLVSVSMAVVATVSALVLGLLISNANTSFRALGGEVTTLSAQILRLDQILRRYGPDTDAAREMLRQYAEDKTADLFPDDLVRVCGVIAPKLGLPENRQFAERFRDSAKVWKAFPDSREALAEFKTRYKLIAMTNARRWALEYFEKELGEPFYATFTSDDTGTEKPDPAFFEQVFAFVAADGGSKAQILHVAQSQYHDIGISRKLGVTNCWIERRHGQKGYGGTIEPAEFTRPDYHFTSMAALADAVEAEAKLTTP